MLDWIRGALSDEARRVGIDPGRLTYFKRIGGDLSAGGKAVFEVLGPREAVPLWVVKAARSPEGSKNLEEEFKRLRGLAESLPETCSKSIPRAIAFEARDTGAVSVETFLRGEKLSRLLRLHRQADVWGLWRTWGNRAIEWLIAFSGSQPSGRFDFSSAWWRELLVDPLASHSPVLESLSPHWQSLWTRILQTGDADWSIPLDSHPPHGDFTPTNIVTFADEIGVFDWSPEQRDQPPGLDLFQFLMSSSLYMGQCLERKSRLADLSTPVCASPQFFECVGEPIRTCLQRNRIPTAAVSKLSLAAFSLKILNLVNRPEPVRDSLAGWILGADGWVTKGEEMAP
ncbi:MAG: phosphotransferase [Candidatus Omnitrophica bacterium]|nr:hypothetical protein [bacterium]NUN95488.1 phosphotransferase [Candidatus Omnitrophota bacterium]